MNEFQPLSADAMLPWNNLPSDERRFHRIFYTSVGLAVVLCLIIPHIPVPAMTRAQRDALADESRIVHIARSTHFAPLPAEVTAQPKQAQTKPKPSKAPEKTPPKANESVKKEAPPAKPVEHPVSEENHATSHIEVDQARAKAANLMKEQGFDQLAALRDMVPQAGGAGGDGTLTRGAGEETGTSRALITSRAGSGSGGLASAGYSGPVSSGYGGGKAGGRGSRGAHELAHAVREEHVVSQLTAADRKSDDQGKLKRSRDELQRNFDKNNGALQALYQHALRDNPALQGLLVLRLTISPDGNVTDCQVASSQLGDPSLEQKIALRVRMFHFEPIHGDTWTGEYTLNFQPPNN